jgi:glycosyltransferase involved in cell wall biosynthesis
MRQPRQCEQDPFRKKRSLISSAHVVPSIEDEASGVSYALPRFCDALVQAGERVELHTLGSAAVSLSPHVRLHEHVQWPLLERFGLSHTMGVGIWQSARRNHILHSHSLWMFPVVWPGVAVRGTKCRLVVSPHGMLSEWALRRSAPLKRLVWWLGQRQMLHRADMLHATADIEYHEIRRLGLKAPIAVIPNGVDVPELHTQQRRAGPRRLLFLSRVHPKKGLDILLRAWSRLEQRFPDWELSIVGPDEGGYATVLRQLAGELGVTRVQFVGPVFGSAKSEMYRSSELFVLPTHSENFGLVVAEALAHGVPAVVTKGAPWSGLVEHDCGYWIDLGTDELVECLETALALSPNALRARGARGREWIERDFRWSRVGEMMDAAYTWVLAGGVPPPCVRVD